MPVIIKVYGAFYPVQGICPGLPDLIVFGHESEPWWFYENDMLQISFEGVAFPTEEVLDVLKLWLPRNSSGKIDVFDLEAWKLARYTWEETVFMKREQDLNHILEYSGI